MSLRSEDDGLESGESSLSDVVEKVVPGVSPESPVFSELGVSIVSGCRQLRFNFLFAGNGQHNLQRTGRSEDKQGYRECMGR